LFGLAKRKEKETETEQNRTEDEIRRQQNKTNRRVGIVFPETKTKAERRKKKETRYEN